MQRESSPLSAVSPTYLAHLYARFREAPEQLDESWRHLFGVLDLIEEAAPGTHGEPAGTARVRAEAMLVEALRREGHLRARLDPLATGTPPAPHVDDVTTLREGRAELPVETLRQLYCGTLTLETAHLDDRALAAWLQDRFEAPEPPPTPAERIETLHDLLEAEEFERFLARKFPTKKRFGAEGAEAILTLMRAVLRRAAEAGVTHVVIGTMHRGRLTLMCNLLGRPPARLFAEIKGAHPFPADPPRPGDVPYHLGHVAAVETGAGTLAVTLLANPSHLEAVDPLVLGAARALQDGREDGAARVLPVVIHTDAAVVGQGVVAEMLQLGGTEGFGTAGTLHVVVNNGIGFTTEPREARTSRHCTGPWKAIDAAIVHVNADDPAAARRAARMAVDWRQAQGRDAVIDLVCYRRNGHNEIDEPTFTQPLLYAAIAGHEPVAQAEARRLVEAGVLDEAAVAAHVAAYREGLQAAYEQAAGLRVNASGYPAAPNAAAGAPDTGVDTERLRELGAVLARPPAATVLHDRMDRILRQRVVGEGGIPWATAEALAFGSLVLDGVGVRLTGQDVVRGAFSHRHFALSDARTGARHVGLAALPGARAAFEVHNSPLSEYAVLGFEYGYSLQRPDRLVLWEAQFGDFANGAQIVIDQFIAGGEAKWCAPSGLVVLLPHGLEGQGPEHSSARLERFLQLAAADNIRVVQPSTPASYFHLLRRQAQGGERRPLVVMAPKRLLRLPAAVSALAQFAPGTAFRPLIGDDQAGVVRRILLCSGKLAYELEAERERRGAADVAVVRLEELYPLPVAPLLALFRRWPEAPCAWVQEEPENMGAWMWLDRRLERLRAQAGCAAAAAQYVGRPESASPAGSFHDAHEADQAALVARAFTLEA